MKHVLSLDVIIGFLFVVGFAVALIFGAYWIGIFCLIGVVECVAFHMNERRLSSRWKQMEQNEVHP